jgi:glycosyltransferase involved in cell wall biosynthesis
MEGFSLSPPVDKEALRRELDLPPGPIVGFAGRSLEAVRGFDVFAKVAKAVRQVRPDVRFLAIGEEKTLYGNETAYLEGRSFVDRVLEDEGLSRDEILFRPFMDYGPFVRHLQAMDLFLFPLFEGAANWGLFEAMAAGLPVVASNRCFVPEVITDGRDGILLDPENVAGYVEATLAALDRPERFRALGQKARRTVARRFSQKAAQDGYAAILREALERAAGSSGAIRAAVA